MTNYDVIKKLIGPIDAVGESNADQKRYTNLEATIELAVLALSKTPIPLNYRNLESHIKLQLKPKNQIIRKTQSEKDNC